MSDDTVRFFGVPERLTLDDGTVIRRYVENDIVEQVDLVNANLDHLAPWMPWSQEPLTVEGQLAWFRDSDKTWEDGTGFNFGIYNPAGELVGGVGYHVRNGPGALEIGYWLARSVEGKGLMTRVAAALTTAAATVEGVTRVEIHCDAANLRSAAIPERLGYSLARVEEREIVAPGECGRHLIYSTDV